MTARFKPATVMNSKYLVRGCWEYWPADEEQNDLAIRLMNACPAVHSKLCRCVVHPISKGN
jgi:hypothetical protein